MEPTEPLPESIDQAEVDAAVGFARRIEDNIRRAVKVKDDVLRHVVVTLLDEDVALGEERSHDVAQHVVADLDGAADVVLDPPREADGGFDLLLRDGSGQRLDRLHFGVRLSVSLMNDGSRRHRVSLPRPPPSPRAARAAPARQRRS